MQLSKDLTQAVAVIRQGGLLAYPTEAVFGLGCDPARLDTVQRLLEAKQRPAEKGLILIAAKLGQLADYLLPLDATLEARVLPSWPGPVTWLLPARPEVSMLLRGVHDTLAVRISAHPVCQALCTQLGHPLISTSANPAQADPALNVQSLQAYFPTQLDLILDLPLGHNRQPSAIYDARSGRTIRPA